MSSTFVSKSSRLDVVDALRGFAVMAILLVHSVEHFLYFVYPNAAFQPGWMNALNNGTHIVLFSLFAGKSYSIFALLFGLTYCIQFNNQQRQQLDFSWRFLWRLMCLVLFATINSLFFPGGDVLLLFVVVGMVLVLVRKWSDKAVFILAVVFLFQPLEWYHYFRSLLDAGYVLPKQLSSALYRIVKEGLHSGSLLTAIRENLTTGQAASLLWDIEGGRFFQTAGLFLLGFLIGRRRLFEANERNYQFWIMALIGGAVLFGPLYALKVNLYDNGGSVLIKQSVGVVLDMWHKLAFAVVLISSFVLLYQKEIFRKLTDDLRWYGRMSLTSYLSQSLIGAILFSPFTLYLAPYCGYFVSGMIGILIFMLQIQFSKWWFKRHKQGPLESLWHKLTWIGVGK